MNKIKTENKSIIFSIIFTMSIYIIVFCFIKIDLSKIKINSDNLINNNFIEIQISKSNTEIKESKKTDTENKEKIKNTKTEIHEKTEKDIIQETINNEDIPYTNKDTFIENENTNNDTTENNNGNFYPVEIAKQITEDIIDRKIIENLFYPEKATRRGIEGKIIIKVEISKNGKLLNYDIISKNNNQILEKSAIITINKIFPIEELMTKNSQEDFSTIISFIYKLN